MIARTTLDSLLETLIQAAKSAIQVSIKKPRAYEVNTKAFSRNFKEAWLYSNTFSQENNLQSTNGTIYFLFWKNLSVTNLSINELISQVRVNSFEKSDIKKQSLNNFYFVSDLDYTGFIEQIWESLFDPSPKSIKQTRSSIKSVCNHLVQYYSDAICRTAILEYYYTSALLHIPFSIRLNLEQAVASSGYIHSAGPGIFARNIEKATKAEVLKDLKRYLSIQPNRKLFLIPYAEEFFGRDEKDHSASSLRNGLDGVRFYFRKHAIGNLSLQEMLAQVPQETDGKVLIASGIKAYWTERDDSKAAGADPDASIWFITDHNVHETDLRGYFSRGTKQYFFVYVQLIYNASQLALFKERKPAWLAPVTLPHTLSAALANIALDDLSRCQSDNKRRDQPIILDAFCGTGTTLIDIGFRLEKGIVIGLDRNPFSYLLCTDNLKFLSAGVDTLENFRMNSCIARYDHTDFTKEIDSFLSTYDRPNFRISEIKSPQKLLETLTKLVLFEVFGDRIPPGNQRSSLTIENAKFVEWIQEILDKGFSETFESSLNSDLSLEQRWLCYLIWRGLVYGRSSVHSSADLFPVINTELSQFAKELSQYLKGEKHLPSNANGSEGGRFQFREGLYSRETALSRQRFDDMLRATKPINLLNLAESLSSRNISDGIYICQVTDSAEALKSFENCFDIIITDPPYGFNTNLEAGSLPELFGVFFAAAVRALVPQGQLIVALPAHSRNGRNIPFYQTSAVVIQQVITAAHKMGKRVANFSDGLPDRAGIFRPPYYWFSPAGVSRSILKFSFY